MSTSTPAGSISSMRLKFEGLHADQHLLDAVEYSKAIDGTSRLYNLVAHYCMYGNILQPRAKTEFKCYSLPASQGSYESLLVILPVVAHDILALSEVYKNSFDWLVSRIIGFIKDKLTGQGSMSELVHVLERRAKADEDLNVLLSNGLLRANDNLASLQSKLIDTLPALVSAAEGNMRKAVTPVGSSCKKVTTFHDLDDPVVITEPEAVAIRSEEELKVGSPDIFHIMRFHSLNVDTGTCIIEVDGYEGHIKGKVSDIALSEPGNPYSSSLNDHSSLKVRARPVIKEDKLYRLYITEPA